MIDSRIEAEPCPLLYPARRGAALASFAKHDHAALLAVITTAAARELQQWPAARNGFWDERTQAFLADTLVLQTISDERHQILELIICEQDWRLQPRVEGHQNRLDRTQAAQVSFYARALRVVIA